MIGLCGANVPAGPSFSGWLEATCLRPGWGEVAGAMHELQTYHRDVLGVNCLIMVVRLDTLILL